MESMVSRFWWGENKIHWIKWKKLYKSKLGEGLGFRTLQDFNAAMLAKLIWRLYTKTNSMVAKILKFKYYPNSDILQANIGRRSSYLRRSLYPSIWIIKQGSC